MPKDGIGPELSCEMCSLSPLFPVTAFRTAFREGGKIVETWVTWDNMAIFGQLGISPCPEEADEG